MRSSVPLFLAPMAGVTNTVFRQICKQEGADVLTSEFVSADGILSNNTRTREYLEFDPSERPFGVQLFGADPEKLGKAAAVVVESIAPDFMDLNFGCPVNKVVCKFGGSALLRHTDLLSAVARSVVRSIAPVPVSAKIRIGWDASSINATDTARLLEDAGVFRIAVHGRTKEQGYSGEADWDTIASVTSSVSIPVVGNGDIDSPEAAARRVAETGVRGLMIGRAAMTKPWLFRQIQQTLSGSSVAPEPCLPERWERILHHCKEEVKWRGDENFAVRAMRSRFMAYTRGMPGGRKLREWLGKVDSLSELWKIADLHMATLEEGSAERHHATNREEALVPMS